MARACPALFPHTLVSRRARCLQHARVMRTRHTARRHLIGRHHARHVGGSGLNKRSTWPLDTTMCESAVASTIERGGAKSARTCSAKSITRRPQPRTEPVHVHLHPPVIVRVTVEPLHIGCGPCAVRTCYGARLRGLASGSEGNRSCSAGRGWGRGSRPGRRCRCRRCWIGGAGRCLGKQARERHILTSLGVCTDVHTRTFGHAHTQQPVLECEELVGWGSAGPGAGTVQLQLVGLAHALHRSRIGR